MDKEVIAYAGSNIPVESRKIFESLSNELRIKSVLTIAIANNARKSAKIEPLTPNEIVLCLQAMAAGIPVLCSPNTKPVKDIKMLKTPLALLSGDNLRDAVEKYIIIADKEEAVKQYYTKMISRFDNHLVELAQEPEFGLVDGKYATLSCHPMNSFVKKIRSEINQAMYVNERATSFLYKAGEIERPEPQKTEED